MLSLFGSLLILSGGLLAWQCHHADRQRRRDTLNDCVTALEHMSEEIRMARTPLPQLMEKLARDCRPDAAALFQKAAKAARQGEALSVVWKRGVETLPLDSKDQETLMGLDLTGDEENLRKGISLAVHRLQSTAEEWERRRPDEVKRAAALYFSAAALLVILLI